MAKHRKVPARQAPSTTAGMPAPRKTAPRLPWVVTLAAVVGAAVAAWWWWPGAAAFNIVTTADQNVLLITIDTLRADALGSYGGKAATPNLDALAGDGIRYDFAHAHAVMTLPSHVSILSGEYPFQHGIRDNAGYRVPKSLPTLASMLQARGFATGAFIGGFPLDSQFGLDTGFSVYDDRLDEVRGPADFALSERPAGVVVGSALTWLRSQQGKWFAWVHVYDPHAPNRPPPPFDAQYRSDPYAGEVAYVDSALGPLLAHVRGLTNRPTLVVVTADHGESLGEHGESTHGVFAYEVTLRAPLIVAQYASGVPTAGQAPRRARVSDAAVQHVDIVPSVLEALGVPVPADLPGRPLVSQDRRASALRASYFEALSASLNRGWAPLRGVLVDREKYIDLPLPELYDLDRDPREGTNLADADRTRLAVLEARLKEFGQTEAASRQAETAETAARLRALGYTSGSAAPRRAYTEDDDPKRLIGLDQDMHRGVVLFNEGRLREAADTYRSVISKRADMGLAYLHLAFLEWELGETGQAIATLRTARERLGADTEIDSRLGTYLAETGALAEAIPLLEVTAERPDAGVDALNALGIAYARKGDHRKALDTFAAILAIDPQNAMTLQNVGSVHLEEGNLAAANDAFRQAIDVNPEWAAAYTGLGVVRLQMNDRAGAITAWSKAVELNPADFDALFNLATELVNDRQFVRARPYAERFVRQAPPAFYGPDIARLRGLLARFPR